MESHAVRIRDGRFAVDVFPVTGWDRVLLNGHRAEVRMQEGATSESVLAGAAEEYRGGASPPGVALVLGGGNVASVTPLDVLHKLYADGQVVVAKTHPVNAYLRPHLDWVFGEFVRRDWLRFVDGGEAEGAYLTEHPSVDSLHATGSDRTHDATVWGTDALAERRRREDAPLVTKPFTSELGGVSPAIVLPGDWSDRGIRFQAEHIVTSKMINSGHNCVASQVLVLPAGWTGSRRLLDEIRLLARELPPHAGYYPGTENRPAEVLARHPGPRSSAPRASSWYRNCTTTTIRSSRPRSSPAPSAWSGFAATVRTSSSAARSTSPTTSCPGRWAPRSSSTHGRRRQHPPPFGTPSPHCATGPWVSTPGQGWGSSSATRPGTPTPATPAGQSAAATGFVHNAFMLGEVEKTVLGAPVAPAPGGFFVGSPSLSPRPPYFATSPTGRATLERLTHFDLDTRFLDRSAFPHLTISERDVVECDFAPQSFDLIHTRALLVHLREREEVYRRALGGSLPVDGS
ncbi:aldehyde dehydrogenase family protein [Streptomyces sp. NPDC002454]